MLEKTKTYVMAISVLTVIIFLVACTQNDTALVLTNASIEMNDSGFSGTETYIVTLIENDVVTIDTRGNAFDIAIVHESGTPLPISGSGVSGNNLRAIIAEDGEYIITIAGSGQFRIFWD